jgi:dTDP-4-dehydrorhamnose 3,5-epimerase
MKFHPTRLDGAWLIEPEPHHDERGYFARVFCEREFGARGLCTRFVQHSLSLSHKRGTLRGMHFQRPPFAEVKLVSCSAGAVHDVIIDLRPGSPTYRQWLDVTLSAQDGRRLYVPAGCAHGFQTLSDNAQVSYLISAFHVPNAASGVRHDDPAFGIRWPLPVSAIAPKDRAWPDFSAQDH